MAVIEHMGAEELRTYLRDKILDDTEFGIQILKGQ